MMNVYVLKHLMDIDEWVSGKNDYSYSMNVRKYGVEFWVFNHRTEKGMFVNKVTDIDENQLEGEKL